MAIEESMHASTKPHHSNQRFCDIDTTEYMKAPGQKAKRKGLRVCHTCKGRIILYLITDPSGRQQFPSVDAARDYIASFANGTLSDNQKVEDGAWHAHGLADFPGLNWLRESWTKIVKHIARELALNLDYEWFSHLLTSQSDPTKAYETWKQRNEARAIRNKAAAAVQPTPQTSPSPRPSSTLSQIKQELLNLLHQRENLREIRLACINIEERRRKAEVDYMLLQECTGDELKARIEEHDKWLHDGKDTRAMMKQKVEYLTMVYC